MSPKLITFLTTIVLFIFVGSTYGQVNNTNKGAAVIYTTGLPTGAVRLKYDSEVAINTTNGKFYRYDRTNSAWIEAGSSIGYLNSGAAPSGDPKYGGPELIINNDKELYWYYGGVWNCVNCAALGYVAGTGINITGTTITNTLPDQTVVLNDSTGILVTGTYPDFTITNTAPDQTVTITGAGISSVTGSYPNFTITSTEVDGSIINEIQRIDSLYLSNDTLFISLLNDALPASAIKLTGLSAATGGGIYGQSDTVTYQHLAVIDSGLTFSSTEDTAYFNIVTAPGAFGSAGYFRPDSIRLRHYDIGGSNELILNDDGVLLKTTAPDRVTIQGNDARYAADYRATYSDRSLIDKKYGDDFYLQEIDTFRVSNDTLYISLIRDSVPESFVVLPAGSGSAINLYELDIITPLPAVDVEGSMVLKTVDVNGSKILYVSNGTDWVEGGLFLDTLNVATINIGNDQVTYAKIQEVTAERLLGNPTGSTANPSEISLGSGLGFSGSTILNTGDLSTTNEIQQIDTFEIVSNVLRASLGLDGVPFKSVDLSPYLDNTDSSGYNSAFTRSGDTLFITDGLSTKFVVLPSGIVDTDDQTLSLSNDTLYISQGNSVFLGQYLDNTDSQQLSIDSSIVEGVERFEISLDSSTSIYFDVPQVTDTDNQTIDTFSITNAIISLSLQDDALPASTIDITESVQDITGTMVESNTETGISVTYDDGTGKLNFVAVDQSITNEIQTLDTFEIVSDALIASMLNDGVPFKSVDLSPYLDNTDTSGYNISFTRSNDTLYLNDGDGQLFVKLPADQIGVDTSGSNYTFTRSNDTLFIADQNGILSVKLPTDNIGLDTSGYNLDFSRSNDTLFIRDGNGILSVKLPASVSTDTSGYNLDFRISDDSLYIRDGQDELFVNLDPYLDNTDTSGSNYTFTRSNDTLFIADQDGILSVKLPADNIGLDTSGYNLEFIRSNDTLYLRDGDGILSVKLPESVSTDTSGYNLQVRISGDTLYIRDGDGELFVDLADYLDNTDAQTLLIDSTDIGGTIERFGITISNGNKVYIDVPQVSGSGAGQNNVGVNIGSGIGIYAGKTDTILQFKSLVEGYGIDLSNTSTEITIRADTAQLATSHDVAVVQGDIDAHELADGDLDDTNELQSLTIDSVAITGKERFLLEISDGNTVAFDVDLNTDTQDISIDSAATTGGQNFTVTLQDGGDVDFFIPTNTDNQTLILDSAIVGSVERFELEVSNGNSVFFDIPQITDTDNQSIDTFTYSSGIITLSLQDDGLPAKTIDISGVNTDNQTIDTFEIVSNVLRASLLNDGLPFSSVSLSAYLDNTDNQTLDTFEIVSNILRASNFGDGVPFKSVDLSPYLDNTDTQDLSVDSTTIGSIERFTINLVGSPSISFDVSNTTGTVTSVAATQPAAGITISGSPITGSGTLTFALANDLAGLEGQSGTGIVVRTGDGTYAQRTATVFSSVASTANLAIGNANGVSGNPLISIETDRATNKLFVQAVSTTNLDLNGTETIDGISVTNGQRVLVAGQTAQEYNGIWDVVSAGAWTRSTDANTAAKIDPGVLVHVKLGATYGGTMWRLTTAGPYTLGTTDLVFEEVFKDEDPTNELQTVDTFEIVSNVLRLSLLNDALPFSSVNLSSYLDNTDSQNLTIEGSGPTYDIAISGGTDITVQGAGIITLSETPANTLVITGTEVDGSITNEIQNLTYTAATGVVAIDGTGSTDATISVMTASTRGLVPDGDGSGTDEFLREDGTWAVPPSASTDLTIGGAGPTYTIESSTGADVTISASGITLSESPANTLVLTAVDGSVTNEIQRLDTFEIVSNTLRASLLNDALPFSSVDLSPYVNTSIPSNQIAYGTGTDITSSFTAKVNTTSTDFSGIDFKIRVSGENSSYGALVGDSLPASEYGIALSSVTNSSTAWYAMYSKRTGGGTGDILSLLENSSANTSADATFRAFTQTTGGDPMYQTAIGASVVTIGMDNSDSDIFKIDYNSTLDASYAIGVNSSNQVGIGGAPVSGKALAITGELQISDLTAATTATQLLGAGASGEVEAMGLGSGFSIVSGALTYTETGSGTVTSITNVAPAAGFTISGTNPITTSGTWTFALADDLAALEGMSGTGIVARTASNTYSQRTITAGTGITIADGNGVSGNPTVTADTTLLATITDVNNVEQRAWAEGTIPSPTYAPTLSETIFHNGAVLIREDTVKFREPNGVTEYIPANVGLYIGRTFSETDQAPHIHLREQGTTTAGDHVTFIQMELDSVFSPVSTPFTFNMQNTDTASTAGDNVVFNMGFNINKQGATYVSGKPSSLLQFESNYAANTAADQEIWFGFNPISSGTFRPLYMTANKTDGSGSVTSLSGQTIYFSTGNTNLNKGIWSSDEFIIQNPTTNGHKNLRIAGEGTGSSILRMRNPNGGSVVNVLTFANSNNYLQLSDGGVDIRAQTNVFSLDHANYGSAIISSRYNAGSSNDTLDFGYSASYGTGVGYSSHSNYRYNLSDGAAIYFGVNGNTMSAGYGALGATNTGDIFLHTTKVTGTVASAISIDRSTGNIGIKKQPNDVGSGGALQVLGHVSIENSGTASELRLNEPSASGTNYSGFKAQAQSGNVVYTLPAAAGTAGQQLTWNSSNILTWEDAGGSPVNIYTADGNIKDGGTIVDVSGNDPIILALDNATTEQNRMLRLTFDHTDDVTNTYGISFVGPNDSLEIRSYDSGMYLDYEGVTSSGEGFVISSNTILDLRGDSILISTPPTRTILHHLLGIYNPMAPQTVSQIEGTANGDILVWNETGGYWEIGTSAGADGNGIYDGSDIIPDGTIATIESGGTFTFDYNGGADAIKFDDGTGYVRITDKSGSGQVQVSPGAINIQTSTQITAVVGSNTLDINEDQFRFSADTGTVRLVLFEPSASGTNYTMFTQPAMAASQTYILPVDAPNNGEFLRWNTGGQLDWAAASGSLSDGDYGDIDVTSGGTVLTVDTSSVNNVKLASGAGGIYKGNGTIASGAVATVTAASDFAIDFNGGNTGLLVSDAGGATSIFSKDNTQFVSADNTQVIVGSGTSKMEYIDGVMRLYDSDATQYVAIQTPATGSLTANYTLTLPVDDGTSGQYLQTNGSGALSWQTISGSGDILNGGNTTGAAVVIGTNDANRLDFEVNNVVGLSLGTTYDLTATASVAATNTVTDRHIIITNVTGGGVASAGFGSGILFQGESSTTDNQDMARITSAWTTATHASKEAKVGVQLGNNGGALAEIANFNVQNDAQGALSIGSSTPVLIYNDGITTQTSFTLGGSSSLLTLGGSSGGVNMGNSTGQLFIQTTNTAVNGISIANSHNTASSTGGISIGAFDSYTQTSGTRNYINLNYSFAPTSGTAVHNRLLFNGTFNQTGGANGIVRAVYDNPTLTAVADYRSFQTDVNTANAKGFVQTGASSTNNFVGGIAAGTTSAPDASAQIDIVSTTKGLGIPSMTDAQRDAITSPREGLVVYTTDQDALSLRDNGIWKRLPTTRTILKTADETVNNSSTYQADDALVFTAKANKKYVVKYFLYVEDVAFNGSNGAMKLKITAPSATTVRYGATGGAGLAAAYGDSGTDITVTDIFGSTPNEGHVIVTAYINPGASDRTVTLEWAQITADASDTKILEGSFLEYEEIN